MALRVIGAGLHRTGTNSLKLALEELLGEPCYHMYEVFGNLEHAPTWHAALKGRFSDWDALFAGYAATVDMPGAAFWPELTEAYPHAIVLLSTRRSAQEWWQSVSSTILRLADSGQLDNPALADLKHMLDDLKLKTFPMTPDGDEQMAGYEQHNAAVRAGVPPERLVEWQPGDGWEPICAALDMPVPDKPFPHVNSTDAFLEQHGLTAQPADF